MKDIQLEALELIGQWGRLRPAELGLLLFKDDPHSRKYAEVICRKLNEEGMVISRKLPGGRATGTAYVLSEKGARTLNRTWGENGYKTGKDWGSVKNGEWHPPLSYKHDIMAQSVLAHLSVRGLEVYSEVALRKEGYSPKHADGIVTRTEGLGAGISYWLEVENGRKEGKHMKRLCEALYGASVGKPPVSYDRIQHAPVKAAAVAIDPEAKDERGCKIDHLKRIKNGMSKLKKSEEINLNVIWVEKEGLGAKNIQIETVKM